MLTTTRIEKITQKLLMKLQVNHPEDLNIDRITKGLGIKVKYWEFESELVKKKGRYIIFLNENSNEIKKWLNLIHEVGHLCLHVGRQENLPYEFVQLQEWQANTFTYYFCVPTFMLDELHTVTPAEVSRIFNVDYSFSVRRVEMYQNRKNAVMQKRRTLAYV
ncbi:ImmA/IrrE family metallo-endopeptidase [Oceanobacillus kimchii]|uniref:ImmA/IrrE family metallo-endopeptidase n=1 Tax=Oceanobacillus kimchii TaxID=746691 RepID=UPI000346C05D|nr:ImmA/IrrE family metallo-endopeptidase [Oceanobacillus kimchii]